MLVLDCDKLGTISSNITNLSSSINDQYDIISNFDVACDEFDFATAVNCICANLSKAHTKITNTSNVIDNILSSHTEIQSSYIFSYNNFEYKDANLNNTDNDFNNNITDSINNKTDITSTSNTNGYNTIVTKSNNNNVKNGNSSRTIKVSSGKSIKVSSSTASLAISAKAATLATNTDKSTIKTVEVSKDMNVSNIIDIPSGLGLYKTYMGWQMVTATGSKQYQLRQETGMNFDEEGFAKIGDRYVLACTTTYGQVGDCVDFVQADGTVIKGIIGDIKSQSVTAWDRNPANKWGHQNGQCVVEFVVDKRSWYGKPMHANPGTNSCHPEWHQTVIQAINYGNYKQYYTNTNLA